MMVYLSIIGMLVLLGVWGLAWRNRPALGFGIFLGVASVWVIGALIQPSAVHHVPLWLPPLPFAIVAVALFYFGTLAWYWGESR